MGSYVGESEENVRNVFASARRLAAQNQPPAAVLFFDEIDSLAPRRGGHASGGNVTDRIVATLLAELERKFDGFTVFCMGATNRPDLLDPSLLRPGRLDRLVYLGVDPDAHASILEAQIRRLNLEVDVEYAASVIAQHLPQNVTGADLSTIASSALLRATHRICAEADEELTRRQDQGEAVTLEQVLESWDESRLNPLVQLEDLLESAKRITASVDESELLRYANLRDEFLTIDVGSYQVLGSP
jgi:peroxin-6